MLDEILERTRARAADAAERKAEIVAAAKAKPAARPFAAALGGPGLSVIAEIKRRSPSAGAINSALDPVSQATKYAAGGAAALSVLTEPFFFGGSLDDLAAARNAVSIPVLRKDFVIDEAQVWEARAAGADAVLLIVAALDPSLLTHLVAVAREARVDALVEVHSEHEVGAALDADASIIGVNNRDLSTFTTDLSVAERLRPLIPDGIATVAESGVTSVEGAARMRRAGYDAVLVGEAVVRHPDPSGFIAQMRGAP